SLFFWCGGEVLAGGRGAENSRLGAVALGHIFFQVKKEDGRAAPLLGEIPGRRAPRRGPGPRRTAHRRRQGTPLTGEAAGLGRLDHAARVRMARHGWAPPRRMRSASDAAGTGLVRPSRAPSPVSGCLASRTTS